MLAVNVAIELSSRIPTDGKRERRKELSAIWERSGLSIPLPEPAQQMQLTGEAEAQGGGSALP